MINTRNTSADVYTYQCNNHCLLDNQEKTILVISINSLKTNLIGFLIGRRI